MRSLVPLLCPLLLVAAGAQAQQWHNDAATCHTLTAAVLRGQANNATAALMPTDAPDPIRRDVHELALRLVAGAQAATHHLAAQRERVLSDRRIDSIPISMELWTFGDKETYFVGCGIRPMGKTALVSLQAYPDVGRVMRHLQQELRADSQDVTPDP